MTTILRDLLRQFEAKATEWETDALTMRKMTPVNPPADTLDYAAKQLLDLVRTVGTAMRKLAPRRFAELHGVSEQTVRRWCARGELPGARQTARGEWEIPADATRTSRRRRAGREKRPA
jgi:DNA-binding transcriptional regulator YiaG